LLFKPDKTNYRINNIFRVVQNIVAAESYQIYSLFFYNALFKTVSTKNSGQFVNTTVYLNSKLLFGTVEIQNKTFQKVLPPELQMCNFAVTQYSPKCFFGIRCITPQSSAQIVLLAVRRVTLTLFLSLKGEEL